MPLPRLVAMSSAASAAAMASPSSSACPSIVRRDALAQARQHAAGPALEGARDAARGARPARSRPSAPGSPPVAPARCGSPRHRGASATSTLCSTGIAGGAIATSARRAARRSGGRLHQRAVERRRHRQQHAALRAARLGGRDRALDGRGVAGDHDLARCIEVDRFDHLALRGFGAGRGDAGLVDAHHRGHRADARRARPPASPARGSAPAAPRRETRVRRRRPAPCTRPGCGRRRCPVAVRPRRATRATPRRRRSSITGCVFTVRSSAPSLSADDERPQVLAQHVRGLGEGLAHRRMMRVARHHADRLRALSRERRMRVSWSPLQ